jgi:hypothetical protein
MLGSSAAPPHPPIAIASTGITSRDRRKSIEIASVASLSSRGCAVLLTAGRRRAYTAARDQSGQ